MDQGWQEEGANLLDEKMQEGGVNILDEKRQEGGGMRCGGRGGAQSTGAQAPFAASRNLPAGTRHSQTLL